MKRNVWVLIPLLLSLLSASACRADPPPGSSALRFEVSVADGLLPGPTDGRLILVLGAPDSKGEPMARVDSMFNRDSPVLGADAHGLAPGHPATVDAAHAPVFPLGIWDRLPSGTYHLQAVFACNRDRGSLYAPGNLYSKPIDVPITVTETPAGGHIFSPSVIPLTLTERRPEETLPADTATVRYIKLRSERLSRFWKRPMYLRAGIVLPPDFDSQPTRRYPLCVMIGGFDSSYRAAGHIAPHADLVQVALDGDGPNGDPYQVNSDNNGPYGDALTKELIPEIEKRFRCVGQPYARFTTGGSTGGWISLALQVFYPKFFGGCWSGFPDPVDFRNYELIDIYTDTNAYTDTSGAERSAMRDPATGASRYTVREECAHENVLSRGDRYTGGTGQWGVWNAVFGARGKDGLPVPLWDAQTGVIDRTTIDHWRKYDLRYLLETHWRQYGPALRGKLHLWVGDADHYYLNGAVHRMSDFLLQTQNPPADATIEFGPGKGHGWYPRPLATMEDEMIASFQQHQPATKQKEAPDPDVL